MKKMIKTQLFSDELFINTGIELNNLVILLECKPSQSKKKINIFNTILALKKDPNTDEEVLTLVYEAQEIPLS